MIAALLLAIAAAGPVKTVAIADNYYAPSSLKVRAGTTVRWLWPDDSGDVHDVKLGRRPKGVKAFQSDPAATGYSFKRRLKVPGTYRIVCTLHEEMTMTIKVRR